MIDLNELKQNIHRLNSINYLDSKDKLITKLIDEDTLFVMDTHTNTCVIGKEKEQNSLILGLHNIESFTIDETKPKKASLKTRFNNYLMSLKLRQLNIHSVKPKSKI